MVLNPRIEAFQVSTNAIGIDLLRSQYTSNLGTYKAAPSAQFRAGQLVKLNSSQQVIICDGSDNFGFAKYNKINTLYATIVGEYIQLNGTTATPLEHGSLFVPGSSGGVRVGAALTGTPFAETTDYTVSYTNGTITRVATGSIGDGDYVYVNYMYTLQEADLDFEGRNFWNYINDVDVQTGLVTVINDWSLIFTAMYDMSETYGVNDKVYAGASGDNLSGMVTKKSTGSFIGRVFQPPTASDPYLAIRYVGGSIS